MPIEPSAGVYLISSESAPREQSYDHAHTTLDDWILELLSLLTGMVACSLFLALRNRREYLAVAVYSFASAGYNATWLWNDLVVYNWQTQVLTGSPSALPVWLSLSLSGWCSAEIGRDAFVP